MPLQCLKFLHFDSVEVLAAFLNVSAIDQLAPATWRSTKVVPLYKGSGNQDDMNNYRSIAVSPPFCKLFMNVMNQRLATFAEANKLHAPTQAGFRSHHTTVEQAMIV